MEKLKLVELSLLVSVWILIGTIFLIPENGALIAYMGVVMLAALILHCISWKKSRGASTLT